MSEGDDLRSVFGLAEPTVPVTVHGDDPAQGAGGSAENKSQRHDQELIGYINELSEILKEIERLKGLASGPQDWQVLMLYVAGQKPRISEMIARSKRIYAKQFGDAFDEHYAPQVKGQPRNLGSNQKVAEARAKRDAGLSYEVQERLERTWRDLQDMLWVVKAVADSTQQEMKNAGKFDAHPEHMFPPEPGTSSD